MAIGTVTFHNDRVVKRFHVKERKNEIVNRLNKTKVVRDVDHEAERQERERQLGRKKKEFALQQVSQRLLMCRKKKRWKPNACIKNKRQQKTIQIVRLGCANSSIL